MEIQKYNRTRRACYFAYLSMSAAFALPPLLFTTFRDLYGISYTLLGTLVLVNFVTQLSIDLICTRFARKFNVAKTVKIMPLLTTFGFVVYALLPTLFPQQAYAGLLIGTVLFSVAAGLCEVMLSPLIASLPSENPGRDMALLHSLYAWGMVSVIVVSTAFLAVFGTGRWMILTLILAIPPLITSFLFASSPIPEMTLQSDRGKDTAERQKWGLALCVVCIFLGSAAENTMTNWISGYVESALGVSKTWGDLLGMALFSVLFGMARMLYARFGRNIWRTLLLGMAGAVVCYLTAGLARSVVVVLVACALTGVCTSMLWPGTLILMEEKLPGLGVAAYALMAAGGDFGASVAPQMMGAIVDSVAGNPFGAEMARTLGLTAEQVGMKTGMIVTAAFPILGIVVLLCVARCFRKVRA